MFGCVGRGCRLEGEMGVGQGRLQRWQGQALAGKIRVLLTDSHHVY